MSFAHSDIDEPLKTLATILQDMQDDANSQMSGKFSQEKMQKFNATCSIVQNFLGNAKNKSADLDIEFFEEAADLVDVIAIVRSQEDNFGVKAAATDIAIMEKIAAIMLAIYYIVYSQPQVIKAFGEVEHVSKKIATTKDKGAGQKLVAEMWEKVGKAELISDAADKKFSAIVKKVQEICDAQSMPLSENLLAEYSQAGLEAFLFGAAASLALAEVEEANAHLTKLIAH